MDTNEFLQYTEVCMKTGEIEKAIQKYSEIQSEIRHNSESATLAIIFAIYNSEKELNEESFVSGCFSISELIDCYNQLKLFLRRFDFDVHYDTTEFVEFIKENHISSSAILNVIRTSMIHPVKVLNQAAMTLLENEEYLMALRILTYTLKSSQDDVTLFNLGQALCCCGEYASAKKVVEQIKNVTSQVNDLKLMIQEKLV